MKYLIDLNQDIINKVKDNNFSFEEYKNFASTKMKIIQ